VVFVVLTLRKFEQKIVRVAPGESPHSVAKLHGAILYEVAASLDEARQAAKWNAEMFGGRVRSVDRSQTATIVKPGR
jgi:hypothetical protein